MTFQAGKDVTDERSRTVTLTNKTLDDATTTFSDNGDPSKKLRFELSGITAGQTRVLTVPNASGNIVLDASTFLIGGNSVSVAPRLGTNSNHALILETAGTDKFTVNNNAFNDNSPYGVAFNGSYGARLDSNGATGYMLGGGTGGGTLILGCYGNSSTAGPMTIRGGSGFGGGGNCGPLYLETGKNSFGDGTTNGFITIRTLGVKANGNNVSGAISILSGEAGNSSGAITIATGSAPSPDTIGLNTGDINISTGSTSTQLVTAGGSVGSINLTCGTANAPIGTLKNGGSITLQSSRGANSGTNGDVNLYTDAIAGLRIASVDGGRLSVLDSSQLAVNDWARLQPRLRSRLFAAFNANTTTSGAVITGTPVVFGFPSGGINTFRNHEWTVSGSNPLRFTYIGATTKWFDFNATASFKKGSGNTSPIEVDFRWFLNGATLGYPYECSISDNTILITGTGQAQLSQNDYIEPYYTNNTNNDELLITACSFNLVEDQDHFVNVDVAPLGVGWP